MTRPYIHPSCFAKHYKKLSISHKFIMWGLVLFVYSLYEFTRAAQFKNAAYRVFSLLYALYGMQYGIYCETLVFRYMLTLILIQFFIIGILFKLSVIQSILYSRWHMIYLMMICFLLSEGVSYLNREYLFDHNMSGFYYIPHLYWRYILFHYIIQVFGRYDSKTSMPSYTFKSDLNTGF